MTYKEIIEKIAETDLMDFADWMFLCTPDLIKTVELCCYRVGQVDKAKIAFSAGVVNCGDEYLV